MHRSSQAVILPGVLRWPAAVACRGLGLAKAERPGTAVRLSNENL